MYKTLIVNQFKNDDSIKVENFSIDELRQELSDKNFIVKVHAAPINPLDLLKLNGEIFTVQTPFTPGSEGSGVIVEAKNHQLMGKKVSFTTPIGSWREYALVTEDNSIILDDNVDLDSASCGFINPLTSQGLIHQALKYHAKGVVNLAAQSALGKMINDLARERGLNCLNIIRGDETRINSIKQTYQNENVITLDQDPLEFQKQVKEYTERLSATVCFDPIGGHVTGQVFNNLPAQSRIFNYGSLSNKDIEGINPVQLRWNNKKLEGFAIFNWFVGLTPQEKKESKLVVKKYANTIFKTQIENQYSFDQVKTALTLFRGMKGGKKIILKPFL